jgi:hypothetical protein
MPQYVVTLSAKQDRALRELDAHGSERDVARHIKKAIDHYVEDRARLESFIEGILEKNMPKDLRVLLKRSGRSNTTKPR